ncbi:GNAT family N-acetyltransferase [Allorhizocola rhizosphaerae]|uniref:GNAT family N-acetyltransferase n=1 Tax=Allorhizocola rhizosphaerae TaxID=1872709 RepID=UPI000E3D63E3|nr:GNAT family N-acetyltransferase [Allorhizocola rhizosphaerae]
MAVLDIRLEPWTEHDLDLLRRLNTPETTEHLGGPESDEKIVDRLARYAALATMFRIVVDGEPAGSIGFWEKEWRGATVYETGWGIVREHWGRGLATAAGALMIERARGLHRLQYMHAFPKVQHAASNAICRKLGFTLVGECDFEYPVGNPIRCNDWRLGLFEDA